MKQLKKIAGYDRVLNAHNSPNVSIFLSLYTKLFYTGVITDESLSNIVKPTFKFWSNSARKNTVQLHCCLFFQMWSMDLFFLKSYLKATDHSLVQNTISHQGVGHTRRPQIKWNFWQIPKTNTTRHRWSKPRVSLKRKE